MPLMFDMPYQELLTYQGTNPSPADSEILTAVGLMGKVCPPSSQVAAYNKTSARKALSVCPDFAHEELPGHMDRAFQFMTQL